MHQYWIRKIARIVERLTKRKRQRTFKTFLEFFVGHLMRQITHKQLMGIREAWTSGIIAVTATPAVVSFASTFRSLSVNDTMINTIVALTTQKFARKLLVLVHNIHIYQYVTVIVMPLPWSPLWLGCWACIWSGLWFHWLWFDNWSLWGRGRVGATRVCVLAG